VTTSKRRARLALIVVLILHACGLGGGSRGTGITSIAEGNVAAVLAASSGAPADRDAGRFAQLGRSVPAGQDRAAVGDLQGITVTVETTSQHSVTDSEGSFLVRGQFESALTLLFTRPADAIHATMAIDIPAGGTLTLHDVTIDNPNGVARAASREVDFTGQMVKINCAAQNLVMLSSQRTPGDKDEYIVRLDTSTLRDPAGDPVSCSALSVGQLAHVHGMVNADGSFGDAQVIVN